MGYEKKELKKIEQKSSWSEEDTRNMQNIESIMFYDKHLPEDTRTKLCNWLKYLKQRIEEQ